MPTDEVAVAAADTGRTGPELDQPDRPLFRRAPASCLLRSVSSACFASSPLGRSCLSMNAPPRISGLRSERVRIGATDLRSPRSRWFTRQHSSHVICEISTRFPACESKLVAVSASLAGSFGPGGEQRRATSVKRPRSGNASPFRSWSPPSLPRLRRIIPNAAEGARFTRARRTSFWSYVFRSSASFASLWRTVPRRQRPRRGGGRGGTAEAQKTQRRQSGTLCHRAACQRRPHADYSPHTGHARWDRDMRERETSRGKRWPDGQAAAPQLPPGSEAAPHAQRAEIARDLASVQGAIPRCQRHLSPRTGSGRRRTTAWPVAPNSTLRCEKT